MEEFFLHEQSYGGAKSPKSFKVHKEHSTTSTRKLFGKEDTKTLFQEMIPRDYQQMKGAFKDAYF